MSAQGMKEIRIGFVGVGGRGTGLLSIPLTLEGVKVQALCDINEANLVQRPHAERSCWTDNFGDRPSKGGPKSFAKPLIEKMSSLYWAWPIIHEPETTVKRSQLSGAFDNIPETTAKLPFNMLNEC